MAELTSADKAFIVAHSALALGFGLSAFLKWHGARVGPLGSRSVGSLSDVRRRGLGVGSPMPKGGGQSEGQLVGRQHNVRTIDERVKLIIERAKHGHLLPELREKVLKVLTVQVRVNGQLKWRVAENDWHGENLAIYYEIARPGGSLATRYTRDMVMADTFQHPRVTMKNKSGDCDDLMMLLAASLMAVGHEVKVRVAQIKPATDYSHIWLLSRDHMIDETKWMPLDLTPIGVPGKRMPPGWEVPGASECQRTGKPAGLCVKVKDWVIS